MSDKAIIKMQLDALDQQDKEVQRLECLCYEALEKARRLEEVVEVHKGRERRLRRLLHNAGVEFEPGRSW